MKYKIFLPFLFLFVSPYYMCGMKDTSTPANKTYGQENQDPNQNCTEEAEDFVYKTPAKRTCPVSYVITPRKKMYNSDHLPMRGKKLDFSEYEHNANKPINVVNSNGKTLWDVIEPQDSKDICDSVGGNKLFKGKDKNESIILLRDIYSEYTKYCSDNELNKTSCEDFFEVLSNEFKDMGDFESFKDFFDNLEKNFTDFCLRKAYNCKQGTIVKKYAGHRIFGKTGMHKEFVKDLAIDFAEYIHYGAKEKDLEILHIIRDNNLNIKQSNSEIFRPMKKTNENLRYYQ